MDHIKELVSRFASNSTGSCEGDFVRISFSTEFVSREIKKLLNLRNGFFAFEGSLHVFTADTNRRVNIYNWNDICLWKNAYSFDISKIVCFAENAFGEQFCINESRICKFDPETGHIDIMSTSMEGWAEMILDDYSLHTGYPLAHEWQLKHGSIPDGFRLVPIKPFVLGGDFSVENLAIYDAAAGMRSRAIIANQIDKLPDGSQVIIQIE